MAKVIANFLFVTIIQILLAPLFIMFYNLHSIGRGLAAGAGAAARAHGRWWSTGRFSLRSPSGPAIGSCCCR